MKVYKSELREPIALLPLQVAREFARAGPEMAVHAFIWKK
jgi:hypothetical protein